VGLLCDQGWPGQVEEKWRLWISAPRELPISMMAESLNSPSVKSLGLWIHSTLSVTGEGSRRDGIDNIARMTI